MNVIHNVGMSVVMDVDSWKKTKVETKETDEACRILIWRRENLKTNGLARRTQGLSNIQECGIVREHNSEQKHTALCLG